MTQKDDDNDGLMLHITTNPVPKHKKRKVHKTEEATEDFQPKAKKKKLLLKDSKKKLLNDSQKEAATSSGEGQSRGRISSLFANNPEIPVVSHKKVKPVEEDVFSKESFESLDIHKYIVSNLKQNFGITETTQVQQMSIPILLQGNDALIRSQTGSGKTLAYAIPILHMLQQFEPKITRADGIKALVVIPTRELALQTYECFNKLIRSFAWLVPGLLVGGEKKKSEKARLRKGINILIGTPGRLLDHVENTKCVNLSTVRKGINILIGTPGRLLDHVENTKCVNLSTVQWFVLDEADRLLDMGYEKDIEQGSRKMIVFMATQDMVDYHTELLTTVLNGSAEFFKLHGSMTQSERTSIFKTFRAAESGVLFCTDVAARGLDLPNVDWIIQYTAPTTPSDYVHRVGRTARAGLSGSALIFLAPSELPFITMLEQKNIKLTEETMDNHLNNLRLLPLEGADEFQRDRRVGGPTTEAAATALQLQFENSLYDQKKLHGLACKGHQSVPLCLHG
ncbi:hypothetical protein LSTR_LSTR007716 [Laodelphax striatellus]|uniref:ATP-dependent RNA helicase n=1 Tax=Laodelphax striatellus TaxID=195883 RepID=A0A482XAN1_LAOST|nr:hypothetical protein LSTR_LSTR007716 [Laodelphax striatellus]